MDRSNEPECRNTNIKVSSLIVSSEHTMKAVPMEDPIQRPFDVAAIFQDLKSFKLGVSSHGGIITYHTTVPSKAILTPSIEYIDIWDYDSEMHIKGLFGEDPGKDGIVTVDGIAVPVEWSHELLICHLPDTGPGSSGDVVVSVRGNKSNVVPLSEWTIPLNVSFDQLGMTTEAILNLRITCRYTFLQIKARRKSETTAGRFPYADL